MTGSTQQDYANMMLGGGRSVEGNRSRSGKNAPAKFLSARSSAKPKAKGKAKAKAKPKSSAKRK
jgi:hypothetical protein